MPKPRKRKSERILPLKLQIRTLKRIFLSANKEDYPDPQSELEQFDFEGILDDGVEFAENQRTMEKYSPQYRWRNLKKPTSSSNKPIWHESANGKFVYTRVLIKPTKRLKELKMSSKRVRSLMPSSFTY